MTIEITLSRLLLAVSPLLILAIMYLIPEYRRLKRQKDYLTEDKSEE